MRERNWNKKIPVLVGLVLMVIQTGCSQEAANPVREEAMEQWVQNADLSGRESPEELYQAALLEDTLIIYSVSSRIFEVKELFEKDYPGLTVEVKDVRGDDIVNMLLTNYEKEEYVCDLVICSDSDGSLYQELIEPGIVYPYVPWDIKEKMKEGHADRELVFLGEGLMIFYNENVFEEQPIQNIWELTEEQYKGKIIMANPLSSFSTYGFCAALFSESDKIEKAYEEYTGKPLTVPENQCAGAVFWESVSTNIVYTNSSDEVLEGIGGKGNEDMWMGIMISSKMRYRELGYRFAPMYRLEPFAAVYTPNNVTIAGGAENINAAKLFVRYLIGETNGTGAGLAPFSTAGTWSVRVDVADGNEVPLCDIDVAEMDKDYLYDNRETLHDFWKNLLKERVLP